MSQNWMQIANACNYNMWGGGEYLKIIISITPGYIFTVNKVYIYEVVINTHKKQVFFYVKGLGTHWSYLS